MNKILTVSIAAYNVENFIEQTLTSCCVSEVLQDLEVLIVDDGATDGTVLRADPFVKKYPDTFRIIHKKNGGYGTTINEAIKLANGKYFRLLDGDDWFDRDGLFKLVTFLKTTSVDAVFTKMYHVYPDRCFIADDSWTSLEGKQMLLSEIPDFTWAGMWEFTVRTSILKEHQMLLPSNTLYTDHIFVMFPIPYIKNVMFLDFPLYCYRLGSEGQSVSVSSRLKHLDEILLVSSIVSKYYDEVCKNSVNKVYALERARFCYMEAYRTLLMLPFSYKNMKRIKGFDDHLKAVNEEIYTSLRSRIGTKSLMLIRQLGFLGYSLVKIKYWLLSNCRRKGLQ